MTTSTTDRRRPAGRRALWAAGLALAVVALGIVSWRAWQPPSRAVTEPPIAEARAALARGDFARAEALTSGIGPQDESYPDGQLVAGEAAMRSGRLAAAAECFRRVPRDGSPAAVLAARSLGEVSRQRGRLSEALQEYAYVLTLRPADPAVHQRVVFLLCATGRRWEARPHFEFLVRSGHATLEELGLLADLERPTDVGDYLRECAATAPDDALVRLGLGAHAMAEGRADEARRLLRQAVDSSPGLVAAHAMLGELLLDAGDEEFAEWHAGLPPDADGHADTWLVRGLHARRRGELRAAARCFWEALRLAPDHRRACHHAGQVLTALGDASGREFAERSRRLHELTLAVDKVLMSGGRDESALRRVTEATEAMGRRWEACAWAAAAVPLFPRSSWPRDTATRLAGLLREDTPLVLDSANLAFRHDLSSFPAWAVPSSPAAGRRPGTVAASGRVGSAIRFREETAAGVDFVYENGADPATKGGRQFEQTGGGAAVLDFDGDAWPDVYFTQGAEWRTGAERPTPSAGLVDRLYRNVRGRTMTDVTPLAGLGDPHFGQGGSAGDLDNDGFPDLYVANIGLNRLYRNNGDGTFSDVTERAGIGGEAWTASCVVVDMNADGAPDLFDVTYLTGPDVYSAICNGHACSPAGFEGAPDRLWLSEGDGTFELLAAAADLPGSKGLGVVAAVIHEPARPSLFIANDQVPNFLLRNSPSQGRWNIRLEDDAFVSGVAFNGDGLPMAGMGVAADDADGDGRIDFFVTNFKDESNTLYLQDADGLFVDGTNSAGLRTPTFPFVGWGTQFLDADLDGEPDIVVANGHVDDYRDQPGGEYHMRPQFFRNTGGGRFAELAAEEAGDWFGRKHLGRGLARLDWNRDGRMDFVVSRIGDRASLLTNESTGVGRHIDVRVRATRTARDAIGTVVEVAAGGRRWRKQLVAGDGYMASNERSLQFGLGDVGSVDEIRVEWPSGEATELRDVTPDVTVELVEGARRGTLWRGGEPESLAAGVRP